MFCSSCGKQINDGARFCEYCGTEQGKSVCISCGKPINSGAKFCEHCGATQTEENTTIPANITPQTVVVSAVSIESDRKSKFTQQEQTKIVGMAASLAATIEVEKEELKRISSASFKRRLDKPYEVASWNHDHDLWMQTKQAKIAFVQGDLKETIDALDVLYTTTKIIPTTYRSVDKLIWLYDDRGTTICIPYFEKIGGEIFMVSSISKNAKTLKSTAAKKWRKRKIDEDSFSNRGGVYKKDFDIPWTLL